MDNSEKLAAKSTQDEKNKAKTHNMRWTPLCANNANNVNKT